MTENNLDFIKIQLHNISNEFNFLEQSLTFLSMQSNKPPSLQLFAYLEKDFPKVYSKIFSLHNKIKKIIELLSEPEEIKKADTSSIPPTLLQQYQQAENDLYTVLGHYKPVVETRSREVNKITQWIEKILRNYVALDYISKVSLTLKTPKTLSHSILDLAKTLMSDTYYFNVFLTNSHEPLKSIMFTDEEECEKNRQHLITLIEYKHKSGDTSYGRNSDNY